MVVSSITPWTVVSFISNIDFGLSKPIPTLYEFVIVFSTLSTLNITLLFQSSTSKLPESLLSPLTTMLRFNNEDILKPQPIMQSTPFILDIIVIANVFLESQI